MEYTTYTLDCLTRMHPGSGDIDFGVVDKKVQRDPTTGLPCIHASSLKGALREHFTARAKASLVEDIFGAPTQSQTPRQGEFRFFGAHLISIPVRSNYRPFFSATTPKILEKLLAMDDDFKLKMDRAPLETTMALAPEKGQALVREQGSHPVEDLKTEQGPILENFTLAGPHPALLCWEDFGDICRDLPVMARNHLENGESKNLWYEEIIPAQTRFLFMVGKKGPHAAAFDEILAQSPVQIGANATIGYGFTRITPGGTP